jgi:hypothetical protein
MASPEVLGLAKQGDPVAIATLMNQVTQPKGILVRVKHQDGCLHLLFEGEQIPKQQTAVTFVRSSLGILNLHSLKNVMIYGRQQGSHHTSWHESLQLGSYFELSPDAQLTDQAEEPIVESDSLPLSPDAVAPEPEANKPEATEPATEPELNQEVDLDRVEATVEAMAKPPAPEPELKLSEIEILDPEILDPEPVPAQSQTWTTEPPLVPTELISMETSSLAQRPETALAETSEIPDFLKRPESIVFILFTTVFVFWEAYLSLLDELAPETSLSCRQLSERLGVSKTTVRKRKRQPGFGEWSKSLDPDGIAWVYETGGLYRPQG